MEYMLHVRGLKEGESEKAFSSEINHLIEEGWRPLGGICVTPAHSILSYRWLFSQALVKTDPNWQKSKSEAL